MPSLDGLDVTTFTIVKIYRFAVAAKKKRNQIEFGIGGSAIFEPPIPIKLVVTHLFCSTLCRAATQKSKAKFVCSNALIGSRGSAIVKSE
jgi:hypothetical protein